VTIRSDRCERLPQGPNTLPAIILMPELELREFVCRDCGTLLEVEVARKGQDSIAAITLDR
jgi:acetone carboxylase gamma subunit